MDIGMLWYDDDHKRPIGEKVARAVEHYKTKYGVVPTVCFANQTRATAIIGCAGQSGFVSKWLLECFGGDHSATVHEHGQAVVLRHAGGEVAPADLPTEISTHADLRRSLESFLRAVIDNRRPPVGSDDGLRVTRMIEAALESAASGQSVNLPLPA